MPRPSFSVVAGTLIAFVAMGAARKWIAPHIPPPGRIANDSSLFIQSGADEAIAWRTFGPDVVREARQKHVPLLVFAGSRSSRAARSLDDAVFTDSDVARTVGRLFIPSRLDLDRFPEFREAIFPLTASEGWSDRNCQLLVFDPAGRTIAVSIPDRLDAVPDRNSFSAFCDYVRGQMQLVGTGRQQMYSLEAQQLEERQRLAGATEIPPIGDGGLALEARVDPASGLLLVAGGGYSSPWVLRAIAIDGDSEFATRALRSLLATPMADPLVNTIFVSRSNDRVEPTGVRSADAAFAQLQAELGRASQDPALLEEARRTLVELIKDFDRPEGMPTYIGGDAAPDSRSPFFSLGFNRLDAAGLSDKAETIRRELKIGRSSQSLGIRPATPTPLWLSAREALRRSVPAPALVSDRLEIQAYTLARLLYTARLLGDLPLAASLGLRVDRLDLTSGSEGGGRLYELLALCDAHLADFIVNGRVDSLARADELLDAVRAQYAETKPGWISAGMERGVQQWNPRQPDLCDDEMESASAMVIRLSDTLAKVHAGTARGSSLRKLANDAAQRSNGAVLGPAPRIAGLLAAFDGIARPRWRVVGGSTPLQSAAQLCAKAPFELILPAIGPVQRRSPTSAVEALSWERFETR